MKPHPYLIIDIETRALPLNIIKEKGLMPSFKAPSNYKDPDKIAAKQAEHESEVMAKAALDPVLSEVCAIGYKEDGRDPVLDYSDTEDLNKRPADEKRMLITFWNSVRSMVNNSGMIVGFNIYGFDFPYLIKRSWHHNVPIVDGIRRGRYWNESHTIDVAEIWKLGDKNNFISLDRLARFLSLGSKTGSGKDFASLLSTDKESALAYLRKDLELTEKVASYLGAIDDDNPRI